MSNSAVLSSVAARNASEEATVDVHKRSQRNDRSAGKGRRRRAAAELRRVEQQHWNHLVHETEEEIYVAPPRPPLSRRQLRRAARRAAHDDWEDSFLNEDDIDLDVTLALSLSLSETSGGATGNLPLDMSYETLVMLENVKCTAPAAVITSFIGHIYKKDASESAPAEVCTICQNEYKDGDCCMILPCVHKFHESCGSEWFLNHSKLCPVCKHDVTENA